MSLLAPTEHEASAAHLLELADFNPANCTVTPLPGGRNNRVFEVRSAAGVHLMKQYQHNPADTRDRLGNEIAFLRQLERVGCTVGPHLFACIPDEHLSLMEHLDGAPLQPGQINETEVDQAVEFFLMANSDQTSDHARSLPVASEACFSIAQHLATTQRRVDRLAQITVDDDLDASAELFARKEVAEVWSGIRAAILAEWPGDAARAELLPRYERCLSPSDFGFHNALRETNGRIRFLDFEYAGWDDPAKLICDFANQPDMPLTRALGNRFRDAVIAAHRNPEALHRRAIALRPLYQLKWACICLNDFLPAGRQRLDFTHGAAVDRRARRADQLQRARQMLARATSLFTRNPFE